MKLSHLLIAGLMSYSPFLAAAIQIGQVPPAVVLEGSLGGKVAGGAWNSSELKDKVSVIFHVAPSEKDLNKEATDAIKDADFDREKYQSYAVINMAASSWPNFVIENKLKASQKEFPHTVYVKDKKKTLVSKWSLADNSNSVIVLDKNERVLFFHDGKLNREQIAELVHAIRRNI